MKINTYFNKSNLWLISVLSIGLFSIFTNHEINRDGVLYLKQATIFSEPYLNFEKILAVHDFPLYAYLIYSISKVFGFSLFISTKVINSVFFILFIIFYKKLILLTSEKIKHIHFFSLISLLSFAGYIDDYLPMIIRDNCFISLFMISLYYFYLAIQKNKSSYIFLCLFVILFSSFFRVEGLFFLFFFTIYYLFRSKHKNLKYILLMGFLLILFLIYFYDLLSFRQGLYLSLISGFDNNLINFASDNPFLDKELKNNSNFIIATLFLLIFIIKFIKGLGLLQSVLVLFAVNIKSISLKSSSNNSLFILIFFILFLVFINFVITGAISKRYFLCAYLIISLFIPHLLIYLKVKFFNKSLNRFYKTFLLIILFSYLINILIDKKMYDNSYINYDKQAALWITDNIHDTESIYLINDRLKFYLSKLDWLDIELDEAILSFNLKYLVLDEPYSKVLLVKENNYQLIKTIPDSKPKIFIFKKLMN